MVEKKNRKNRALRNEKFKANRATEEERKAEDKTRKDRATRRSVEHWTRVLTALG